MRQFKVCVLFASMCLLHGQQTLDNAGNSFLSGNYFFRWTVYSGPDAKGARKALAAYGIITFDGKGAYQVNGRLADSTSAAPTTRAFTPTGRYTVSSGGMAEIDNPIIPGDTLYAGVGSAAVVGSSTEGGNHDLFVAIPAPAAAATSASLSGTYRAALYEYPRGSVVSARNAFFSIEADGKGGIAPFQPIGSSADGAVATAPQNVTGATYTLTPDGSGTASFPSTGNQDARLLSGSKFVLVSADGDVFLAGSPTGFDTIIGLRSVAGAAVNSAYRGLYYSAAIQHDARSGEYDQSLHGARNIAAGNTWYQERIGAAPDAPANHYDGTDIVPLSPFDASGMYVNQNFYRALGAGGRMFFEVGRGKFFEIYVGVQARSTSGTGVFLNPYGVVNAANLQPPTNPIAPGEMLSIFGSGFATSRVDASSLPLPTTLGNVQVTINGRPAPLISVGPEQINLIVPAATSEPYAHVQVSVSGKASNTVASYRRASAPGMFTIPSGGVGNGAVLHLDYSLVAQSSAAHPGETVMAFMTGLGAVSPTPADGAAAATNPLSLLPPSGKLAVYVGGLPSNVTFAGLAPGFASLYQVNFEIPAGLAAMFAAGSRIVPVPVEVATADGATIATIAVDLSTSRALAVASPLADGVNTAPAAVPQSITTIQNAAAAITLSATDAETPNAVSPYGSHNSAAHGTDSSTGAGGAGSLTFAVTSQPAHGTLSGTPPNLTYSPTANYLGTDTFQFTATDRGNPPDCAPGPSCAGPLTSTPATVSILVLPANSAPTAASQNVTAPANRSTNIALTGSDAETPAGSLTFTVTVNPLHGTLAGAAPNVTYTPTSGYVGPDSFQFTVTDRGQPDNCGAPSNVCAAALTSASATVTINVGGGNAAPTAVSQTVSVAFGFTVPITLSGTDFETPANALTFNLVSQPQHGTLSGSGANLVYRGESGFYGDDSFQFTVTDRGSPDNCGAPSATCLAPLTSTPGTITISVLRPPASVNAAPQANAQSLTANEGVAKPIVLTGSDLETAAASLAFTIVSQPSHGVLSGTAPNVTYTPTAGYFGPDSFQFKVTDRGSPDGCSGDPVFCAVPRESAPATISILVTPGNAVPTATPQTVVTSENTAKAIVLAGTDTETSVPNLTFAITTSPTHGTLSGTAPNVTYTPNTGYYGTDSFQFTVTDRGKPDNCGTPTTSCGAPATSTPATVAITVSPINTAPTATAQSVSTNENVAKAITLAGSDTETSAANLSFTITAPPAHGTLSGTAPNLTYTPAANYIGADTLQFTVTDRGKPDNCGAAGPLCSATLTSTAVTVSISVLAVNTPPTASGQSLNTLQGTALPVTLSGSDTETAAGNLTFTVTSAPAHGTLTGTAPNLTYTPAVGYFGADSFQFKVHDRGNPDNCGTPGDFCAAGLDSGVATISINVSPVNTAPTATAQSANVNENTPTAITLAGTDTETAPANLAFTVTTPPAHGTLSGTAPNVTYTPASNYIGADSFQFTVTDRGKPDNCGTPSPSCSAALTSSSATVSLTVLAVNTTPTANAQAVSTTEGAPLAITLTGSDPETAAANLTFAVTTPPAHGTLTGTAPNLTYTPNAGYFGPDSLQFTVTDRGNPDACGAPGPTCAAAATSSAATVTITVSPVNTAPSATAQSVSTNENTAKAVTLAGTDTETAAGNLAYTVTVAPSHGTLSGTAPNLTYTPNANYIGADSFQFTVTDRGKPDNCGAANASCSAALTSAAATVSISVLAVNTPPVANAQSVATNEGVALPIALTGTDVETSAANLTYTVMVSPTHGILTGTAPNLTYTPTVGYFGVDAFQFKVHDRGNPDNCGAPGNFCAAGLDSTVATVTITIVPVNIAPVATAQTITAPKNVGSAVTLAGTDTETAPANLTFTVTTQPAHGTLSGTAPNLTYTPTTDYTGPDSLQFTVTDRGKPDNCGTPTLGCSAALTSAPATVSITVAAVNTVPTANAQSVSTAESTPAAVTLTGSDVETAAANLSFAVTTGPAHGTLSGTAPNLTYTPTSGYFGPDSLQFTVTDRGSPDNCGAPTPTCLAAQTSTAATVTITVVPVNVAPTATAQSVSTNQDTAKAITLAGTDTETALGNLTFNVTVSPTHGTLTGAAPNLMYTPTAGYFGPDSLQFTVTDRGKPDNCGAPGPSCAAATTSSAATVSITVVPVNTAPTANAQSVTTTTNNAIPVTLTGSDTETAAGSLTFTVTANPTHGTLSGTAPNLTYTPTGGYAGTDSFQFKATDRGKPDNCGVPGPACAATLDSVVATVSITVNQPPSITSLNNVTFAPGKTGQSFTVQTTGFPTGASMAIGEVGPLPSGVNFTDNHNGTATINGTPAAGTQGSTGTPRSQAYPVTLSASNGIAPDASQPFTLNITCPVITVTGTATFNMIYGASGSTTYSLSGGNGAISWLAVGLPPSISIDSGTGAVSGTPTATGTWTSTVTATDAGGCTGSLQITVAVGPSLASQSYTGVGNTQLYVSGVAGTPTTPAVQSATTLLSGSTPAASVTNASCSAGGTITGFDATGRFLFTPNVSATSATCTYTASSNTGSGAGSTGAASTTASLTFTLNNKVWYVNHGASGGDGRSHLPFGDFGAGANQLNCTSTSNGDYIYVHQGTGNTTGACALKPNQTLIGAGATLTVGSLSIAGNPATTPTITGTLSASSASGLTVNGVSMSTGASTAVNLTDSDGNFTFRSISASGGSNGIVWNNASAASGSFTVTGDGTDTSVGGNSSGGTIANMSGADNAIAGSAIYLKNARSVTLRRITINGTNQNFGIRGTLVNGFTLEYSTVVGTNGTGNNSYPSLHGEGSIYFGTADDVSNPTPVNGITGSGTFTNNVISGGAWNNLDFVNGSGTVTLTFKGNTFNGNLNTGNGNHSLAVEARGNATMNTVVGGTSAGEPNTFTSARATLANFAGQQGTTMDVVFRNNTLSNNHPSNNIGGGSLYLASAGTMTFHVTNNTMRDADGSAVTFFKPAATAGTPSMSGYFAGNTIGSAATLNSGSKSGNGIFVSAAGTGTMSYTIVNNVIHQIKGNGHIYADNTGGSYIANFTIEGNTLDTPGTNWFAGIAVTNGSPTSTDTINVCAKIGGSTAGEKNTLNVGAAAIGVIVGSSGAASGHTFNLPGYGGGANFTNVQNFLTANNTGTFISNAYADAPATASAFTGSGSSCSTPAN